MKKIKSNIALNTRNKSLYFLFALLSFFPITTHAQLASQFPKLSKNKKDELRNKIATNAFYPAIAGESNFIKVLEQFLKRINYTYIRALSIKSREKTESKKLKESNSPYITHNSMYSLEKETQKQRCKTQRALLNELREQKKTLEERENKREEDPAITEKLAREKKIIDNSLHEGQKTLNALLDGALTTSKLNYEDRLPPSLHPDYLSARVDEQKEILWAAYDLARYGVRLMSLPGYKYTKYAASFPQTTVGAWQTILEVFLTPF